MQPCCDYYHDPDHCTGHRRDGKPCGAWPMGGQTVCRMHGGASPQARNAARQRLEMAEAQRVTATYGVPRDVDPHTALMEQVQASAGHVAYLGAVVGELQRDDLVRGVTRTVMLPDGSRRVEISAAVSVYLQLYNEERDRLARMCATAIKCGVEVARVEMERDHIQRIAEMVRGIVTGLGHDLTDPHVGQVVRTWMLPAGEEAA